MDASECIRVKMCHRHLGVRLGEGWATTARVSESFLCCLEIRMQSTVLLTDHTAILPQIKSFKFKSLELFTESKTNQSGGRLKFPSINRGQKSFMGPNCSQCETSHCLHWSREQSKCFSCHSFYFFTSIEYFLCTFYDRADSKWWFSSWSVNQ